MKKTITLLNNWSKNLPKTIVDIATFFPFLFVFMSWVSKCRHVVSKWRLHLHISIALSFFTVPASNKTLCSHWQYAFTMIQHSSIWATTPLETRIFISTWSRYATKCFLNLNMKSEGDGSCGKHIRSKIMFKIVLWLPQQEGTELTWPQRILVPSNNLLEK